MTEQDDQPVLPFGKAEQAKPLVPTEAELPARELIKLKAKEMYGCGWTAPEIVKRFAKFPDTAHVTLNMVNNWRQRDNWQDYRRQVQIALAKTQLERLKKVAGRLYSDMDAQVNTVQRRLFNALEGLDRDGNMVLSEPPPLHDGPRIVDLILKSIELRRSMVADALDRVSESLPLVDPSTLDLFVTPRDRIIDTPPPPEEEEEDGPEERTEAEDESGSGAGG